MAKYGVNRVPEPNTSNAVRRHADRVPGQVADTLPTSCAPEACAWGSDFNKR